jgi:Cytochrome P460
MRREIAMRYPFSRAAIVFGLAVSVLAFGNPPGRHIGVILIGASIAAEEADGQAAPIYGIKIPQGYRDWRMISAGNVGVPVNDVRVKLGNDIAIKAFRDDRLPFPDGTIIARLAYKQITSQENNKALGQVQSFVAGPATNLEFMIKDSKKYAASGGWGFAQFTNGKPDDETVHKACFGCHTLANRDFVFTHYSP